MRDAVVFTFRANYDPSLPCQCNDKCQQYGISYISTENWGALWAFWLRALFCILLTYSVQNMVFFLFSWYTFYVFWRLYSVTLPNRAHHKKPWFENIWEINPIFQTTAASTMMRSVGVVAEVNKNFSLKHFLCKSETFKTENLWTPFSVKIKRFLWKIAAISSTLSSLAMFTLGHLTDFVRFDLLAKILILAFQDHKNNHHHHHNHYWQNFL